MFTLRSQSIEYFQSTVLIATWLILGSEDAVERSLRCNLVILDPKISILRKNND